MQERVQHGGGSIAPQPRRRMRPSDSTLLRAALAIEDIDCEQQSEQGAISTRSASSRRPMRRCRVSEWGIDHQPNAVESTLVTTQPRKMIHATVATPITPSAMTVSARSYVLEEVPPSLPASGSSLKVQTSAFAARSLSRRLASLTPREHPTLGSTGQLAPACLERQTTCGLIVNW
jgi:hypothetical protein